MNEKENPKDRLQKLQQQQEKIRKQIAREKKRRSDKARKDDTRRKILAGAVLLEAASKDQNLKSTIDALLNAKLTREHDRALFGLAPLPGNENKPESENSTAQNTGAEKTGNGKTLSDMLNFKKAEK